MENTGDTARVKNTEGYYRRRTKWVRPELQLKVIGAALLLGVVILTVNLILLRVNLLQFKEPPTETATEVVAKVRASFVRATVVSLVAAIPLSVLLGIFFSFRFCGPIYRFRKFFQELDAGRWDSDCHLRQGDNLQDLRAIINRVLRSMRERLLRQHDLIRKYRQLVEEHSDAFGGDERVGRLLEETDRETAEIERRFATERPATREAKEVATAAS